MASDYSCDSEDGQQATISVGNMLNGETQFLCASCFAALGAALMRELDPDGFAAMHAPVAAEVKSRKRKVEPVDLTEPDESGRTIATITESEPRPPGEDQAATPADRAV